MPAPTIAQLLREEQGIAPLEARVLLREALQVSDAFIAAHPEQPLTPPQVARCRALMERRRAGEPVAYLTGEREFYSLPFNVSAAVLIPRPETELLVELALELAPAGEPFRLLDLATGSGCVAIAIARHCARARLTATDVSREALALARDNSKRHGVAIEFLESDWFAALAGRRFEMIIANPPYVADGDPHLDTGDARFEPRRALVAGPTGYECIERIAADARMYLEPSGWLMLEHGHEQGGRCREMLARLDYAGIVSRPDLAGHERVTLGRR